MVLMYLLAYTQPADHSACPCEMGCALAADACQPEGMMHGYVASRMSISDSENVVQQATGRHRHRQLIQQETRQQQ